MFGCLEVVYCSSGFESTSTENQKQGQIYICGVLMTTHSGLTCCEQSGIRMRLYTTRKIPYLDKEKLTTYRKRSLSYRNPKNTQSFKRSLKPRLQSREQTPFYVFRFTRREMRVCKNELRLIFLAEGEIKGELLARSNSSRVTKIVNDFFTGSFFFIY